MLTLMVVSVVVVGGTSPPQKCLEVVRPKWCNHVNGLGLIFSPIYTITPDTVAASAIVMLFETVQEMRLKHMRRVNRFRAYVWNCYCSNGHCEFVLRQRCRYHESIYRYTITSRRLVVRMRWWWRRLRREGSILNRRRRRWLRKLLFHRPAPHRGHKLFAADGIVAFYSRGFATEGSSSNNCSANIANFHWVFFTSQYYILYNIIIARPTNLCVFHPCQMYRSSRAKKVDLAITCVYDKNNCIGHKLYQFSLFDDFLYSIIIVIIYIGTSVIYYILHQYTTVHWQIVWLNTNTFTI